MDRGFYQCHMPSYDIYNITKSEFIHFQHYSQMLTVNLSTLAKLVFTLSPSPIRRAGSLPYSQYYPTWNILQPSYSLSYLNRNLCQPFISLRSSSNTTLPPGFPIASHSHSFRVLGSYIFFLSLSVDIMSRPSWH